jgi:epoxyqueuosine reductase
MLSWDRKTWMEISEDVFRKTFRASAVKRAGYKGLKRNLDALQNAEVQKKTIKPPKGN